jgi:hypothetical protein
MWRKNGGLVISGQREFPVPGAVLFGLLSREKSADRPAFRWIYSARMIANLQSSAIRTARSEEGISK